MTHTYGLSENDRRVPRVSEFYGVSISFYFEEHPPPHFHARYAGLESSIAVATGMTIEGALPKRVERLVREWAKEYRVELEANWTRARNEETLKRIAPLK